MKKQRKTLPLILAVVLILALCISGLAAGGVFASLIDTTSGARGNLRPAQVTCAVRDDYRIDNTGDIPALIRAKVIVNWTRDGVVAAGCKDSWSLDYGEGWTKVGDYWYYTGIVPAGGQAPALITAVSKGGSEYELEVQVLAEAIQATPQRAIEEAWGVSYQDVVRSE